uniref:Uncharacterized protein n=1 Tax=Oryza meridionalis TaxID=40149 RepID=A0A0E0E140_9ORYZ
MSVHCSCPKKNPIIRGTDDRSSAVAAALTSHGLLLKSDLLTAMAELQRQGYWSLAFATLHVARAKPWYRPNPTLYATFVSSSPVTETAFLEEKERGSGFVEGGGGHLTQLVRTQVVRARTRAGRSVYEAAVRMGGCEVDKYMYMVMARGMKRLGFQAEVEADFREWKAKILPSARDMLDEMRAREEQHNNGLTMNLIISLPAPTPACFILWPPSLAEEEKRGDERKEDRKEKKKEKEKKKKRRDDTYMWCPPLDVKSRDVR